MQLLGCENVTGFTQCYYTVMWFYAVARVFLAVVGVLLCNCIVMHLLLWLVASALLCSCYGVVCKI